VSHASDRGTVTIHGDGLIRLAPLHWQGKALTVRAEGKDRPCLEFTQQGSSPWEPLLYTDRALTLEGIDLRQASPSADGASSPAEPGPLLCCQQATLRLSKCRLRGRGPFPLVVVRNSLETILEDCQINTETVALSVEVGQAPSCRIDLRDCTFTDQNTQGAALSLWAPEIRNPTPVDLSLERNSFRMTRVLALRALPGSLNIQAVSNRFTFRESLLSFTGYSMADAWRRSTTWQGRDNHYDSPGPWLRLDGEGAEVRDLSGWCRLWNVSEPQSRDNPTTPTVLQGQPQTPYGTKDR
jgi:hypothetical protein